mgnify:CR=1 FL=1
MQEGGKRSGLKERNVHAVRHLEVIAIDICALSCAALKPDCLTVAATHLLALLLPAPRAGAAVHVAGLWQIEGVLGCVCVGGGREEGASGRGWRRLRCLLQEREPPAREERTSGR